MMATKIGSGTGWEFYDDGVLKITGNYARYSDFTSYKSQITSVVINEGVTKVRDHLCNGLYKVTSVSIPDSVTSIEEYAFSGCTILQSVSIPDSVTLVSRYAFSGCTGLQSISIPSPTGYCYVYAYAFNNCSGLSSVSLGKLNTISEGMFSGCTNLTEIEITNSVRAIENYAFKNSGILKLVIPTGVTEISLSAFKNSNISEIYYLGTTENYPSLKTCIPSGVSYYYRGFSSIELISQPLKTEYNVGEVFSADGMEIQARYNVGFDDEYSENVSDYSISPSRSFTASDLLYVTISRTENGKSSSINISISLTYRVSIGEDNKIPVTVEYNAKAYYPISQSFGGSSWSTRPVPVSTQFNLDAE